MQLPAGSVQAAYFGGNSSKWVPPAAFGAELRKATFEVGDSVAVFVRRQGLWVEDGQVTTVLHKPTIVDGGIEMPIGSVQVMYDDKSMAKWVPPAAFDQELRAQRPWSADELAQAEYAVPEPQKAAPAPKAKAAFWNACCFVFMTRPEVAGPSSPKGASGEADPAADAESFLVAGPKTKSVMRSGFLGRYRIVGEHQERPKYQNASGAIMFFDGHWKMNSKDDTLHWCYEVLRCTDYATPPPGPWTAWRFFSKDAPDLTVSHASEADKFVVSGAAGSKAIRGVNGRYMQVGEHNEKPLYRNDNGAVIYFDSYWKLNEREDNVLAWRFSVRGSDGDEPPL